jgi:chromosomal replication initiation ATPase DnaA
MTKYTYETHLRDSRGHRVQSGVLQVIVANAGSKEWLEARLMHVIRRTLQRVSEGRVTELNFVIAAEVDQGDAGPGTGGRGPQGSGGG